MFEVKIPEWSDMVLMTRYENIKPLLREKPNGPLHWIKGRDSADDLRYTAYMWEPEYLREVRKDELKPIENYDFVCLHTWGSPNFFKPSIAEVLSQIDYDKISKEIIDYKSKIRMRIVGFEIIDYPKTAEDFYKDDLTKAFFDMGYHISKVRLYASYKSFNGFPEGA